MRIIILFWICAALVITDMTEAHPMSDSQRCICTGQMRSQIRPQEHPHVPGVSRDPRHVTGLKLLCS
uniref:Chemokine interleukin-8-like domain-containing protein n=1 Tax=Anguilla anguilla TaxID=7936 RepID=A0A0E9U7N5_ANGAN